MLRANSKATNKLEERLRGRMSGEARAAVESTDEGKSLFKRMEAQQAQLANISPFMKAWAPDEADVGGSAPAVLRTLTGALKTSQLPKLFIHVNDLSRTIEACVK